MQFFTNLIPKLHLMDIKILGGGLYSYLSLIHILKDHRTGLETGNVNAVMDGELDGFINAYLTALSQGTLGENIE